LSYQLWFWSYWSCLDYFYGRNVNVIKVVCLETFFSSCIE